MIIDTHVHIISEDLEHYPKTAGAYPWPVFSAEGLIAAMEANGIDRALLVQPYFTYGNDNSYMIDSEKKYPGRFKSVCVIDQLAADAPAVLTDLVQSKGVVGVRLMAAGRSGYLGDPRCFPLLDRAGELDVPVCLAAEMKEIPEARALIERFPQLTIMVEHMWGANVGGPSYDAIKPVLDLARFTNVRLKIAPNNSFAAREGQSSPREFFKRLVDAFGAQRIMWGSNYPAHWDKYGTVKERLLVMRHDLNFLTEAEQANIFGGSALAVWPACA